MQHEFAIKKYLFYQIENVIFFERLTVIKHLLREI